MKANLTILLIPFIFGACVHRQGLSKNAVTNQVVVEKNEGPAQKSTETSSLKAQTENPTQNLYFDWPVDQARMTRGFLPNRRKPHKGIDLAAPKGTKIYASHEGVVIYTGREFKGYGKMIMIEGPDGWASLYAHFSKIIAKEGQMVKKGDIIGAMGSTGHSTGSHLHFEIRRLNGPVDPLLYLPKIRRVASHSN